ncbi:sensor histidine kinase [Chitinophaga lutea]
MNLRQKLTDWRLHHVLFWCAFFVVWITLRIDDYPDLRPTILAGLLKVLSLAGAVYFTSYVLIPRFLYQKRYVAFFAAFTLLVGVTGWIVIKLLNLILRPYAGNIAHWPNATWNEQLYDVYIPLFFMVGAAASIKFYLDRQRALHANTEQELQYLRSQINPHALFNSLNAIYFLISKDNREARETLMKFSDLLRYQLYECNGEKTEIEKEVNYLRNYVTIQQLRHGDQYRISFESGPAVRDAAIAPLLLIPFVENAFKHVSSSRQPNEIDIRLEKEGDRLSLHVYNTCDEHLAPSTGGIGLANVKRRLELLYPGRYDLEIRNGGPTYRVTLNLDVS